MPRLPCVILFKREHKKAQNNRDVSNLNGSILGSQGLLFVFAATTLHLGADHCKGIPSTRSLLEFLLHQPGFTDELLERDNRTDLHVLIALPFKVRSNRSGIVAFLT